MIDAKFNGLQRISRHRLIYAAVSEWMPAQVHALHIIAMTLEEAVRTKCPRSVSLLRVTYRSTEHRRCGSRAWRIAERGRVC